jgi:hypothetical protein
MSALPAAPAHGKRNPRDPARRAQPLGPSGPFGLLGGLPALALAALVLARALGLGARAPPARTVTPIAMDDADAAAFFSGDWFVQWQTPTRYLPAAFDQGVVASYTPQPPSWPFGYTVRVHNVARDAAGTLKDSDAGLAGLAGGLGAQRAPDARGSAAFLVAPPFVPPCLAGDYWVVAREPCAGTELAVVCGGQPTIPAADGAFTYDTAATNNAGFWALTRAARLDDAAAAAVRARVDAVAARNAISLIGLRRVSHGPR